MPPTKATKATADATVSYQSNPFELIRPSWEGVKLNWPAYLAVVALIMGIAIVGFIVGFMVYIVSQSIALAVLIGLALLLGYLYYVTIRLNPAFYRLQLAMARHQKLSFAKAIDVKNSLGWRLFGTNLLGGIIILGGLIALVIPGLIFMVWFSLASFVVVEEDLSGWAALTRSRKLVISRFWDTVGTLSIAQASNLFMIIPGLVGSLASLIVGFAVMPTLAIRYDQLVALDLSGHTEDIPTSSWNLAIILIALVAFGISSKDSAKNFGELQHNSTPTLEKTSSPY